MTTTTVGLLVLVVVTCFLSGLIWTVQVVHYPLFAQVGTDGFAAYASSHATRIGPVVGIPWAVHGAATAWLLTTDLPRGPVFAAAALAAVTVVVTLVWSVPAHQALADGHDLDAVDRLVSTNWLRTAAWTANAGVALWLLVHHLRTAGP